MTSSSISSLNTLVTTIPVILASIGVAFGQGLASYWGFSAVNIQPAARSEILKTSLLSMAIVETSLVLNLAITLLLIFGKTSAEPTLFSSISMLGIIITLGLSGFLTAIISWWTIKQACLSTARQPFFSVQIFNLLMITLALLQTPVLFSFILAWLIKVQSVNATNMTDTFRLIGGSLAFGLGCIGPLIGVARFTQSVMHGLGVNREAHDKLFSFTLISEAMIGTPLLFSFIVSLLFMIKSPPEASSLRNVMLISSALSIGIGTFIPGLQSGIIAATASKAIAKNPDNYSVIARASFFSQAFMDSFSIYAFLISLFLLLAK